MTLQEKLAQVEKGETDSNCWGTALYLVGAQDKDDYVDSREVKLHLTRLKKMEKPMVGSLAIFDDGEHVGVITSVDPLIMTHRPGRGELSGDNPLGFLRAQNISDRGYESLTYHVFDR